MANNETIIMDDGEPYVHLATLIADLNSKGEQSAHSLTDQSLVPGIAVVVSFLTNTYTAAILSDRQD